MALALTTNFCNAALYPLSTQAHNCVLREDDVSFQTRNTPFLEGSDASRLLPGAMLVPAYFRKRELRIIWQGAGPQTLQPTLIENWYVWFLWHWKD